MWQTAIGTRHDGSKNMHQDNAENSNPTACDPVPEALPRKPAVLYIDRYYDSLREDSFAFMIAASLRRTVRRRNRIELGAMGRQLGAGTFGRQSLRCDCHPCTL